MSGLSFASPISSRFGYLFPILLLVGAYACGGGSEEPMVDDDDDDDDMETVVETSPFSDHVTKLRDLDLAFLEACVGEVYGLEESTRTDYENTETGYQTIRKAAVDGGTVTYDEVEAAKCFSYDDLTTCEEFIEHVRDPKCNTLFEGTIAAGGECNIDEECEGESFCAFTQTFPECTDDAKGTCTAKVEAGAACHRNGQCSGETFGCVNQVCAKRPTTDEACGGAGGDTCARGLTCVATATPGEGVCKSILSTRTGGIGDECIFNIDDETEIGDIELCQEGLACVLDVRNPPERSSTRFVCVNQVAQGQACALGFPGACEDGFYCQTTSPDVATGTCTPLPTAGAPCAVLEAGNEPLCLAGLSCSNGTCVERADIGEACTVSTDCLNGLCVDDVCTLPSACQYVAPPG